MTRVNSDSGNIIKLNKVLLKKVVGFQCKVW
jgi:hypothetical protein